MLKINVDLKDIIVFVIGISLIVLGRVIKK
jgi:hypothetical protein